MENITLDTTNFSEQLGLYDFFNVVVSGSILIVGISMLVPDISSWLWSDLSIVKGIGIVLFIYIVGNIVQELGWWLDRLLLKVKKRTRSTFLFDIKKISRIDRWKYWWWVVFKKGTNYSGEKTNLVIDNKNLLKYYRKMATQIYEEYFPDDKENKENYQDEAFNSFIFPRIQYRVSYLGKDAKAEKLRALYGLSRDLIICFLIFAVVILVIFVRTDVEWNVLQANLTNAWFLLILLGISILCMILFFLRMKRCKRYRILIILGNYDASIRCRNNGLDAAEKK